METDNFKSSWQQLPTESTSPAAISKMIRENRHPVLKGIRIQLIIETIGWGIFLLVYYDFFDGDRKPFYANVILVAAVGLMLVHNIAGYFTHRNKVAGGNLNQSLQQYLAGIKQYARIAITSRVMAILAFLLFFLLTVQWTPHKYWLLTLLLIIPVQVWLLYKVWANRIKQISQSIASLNS
jgi:hypothetical protein